MTDRIHNISKIALVVMAISGVSRAQAQIFDLAANWSDTVNPNGAWAYGTMTSGSLLFSPFLVHVNDYINVGGTPFTGNQPAWTNTTQTGNNGSPQGLAKSIGVASAGFDFPLGRVGGHTLQTDTYLAARWTAPAAMTVDLTGGTWMWRNVGRINAVSLFHNNTALFDDVNIPSRATGIISSNTFTLDSAIVADGGLTSSLRNISVNAGQTITLAFRRAPGFMEDFVGMDFRVTPIPEPGLQTAIVLVAFAGTAVRQQLRRANEQCTL